MSDGRNSQRAADVLDQAVQLVRAASHADLMRMRARTGDAEDGENEVAALTQLDQAISGMDGAVRASQRGLEWARQLRTDRLRRRDARQ